jgi:AcrR family transcriptional regulator
MPPARRRTLTEVHDDHHRRHGRPPSRGRGGRPAGSTREAILEASLRLFIDQGYDKTSLREIADVLRFTKAALYYHFERKEDILLALHQRLHDLASGALDELAAISESGGNVDAWIAALDKLIDEIVANRALFVLHQRNQQAFAKIEHDQEHSGKDHEEFEDKFQRALSNPAVPLPMRVRMACSFGAVMTALMLTGSGEAFGDVERTDVVALVRDAVRDLMALTPPAGAGAGAGARRPPRPARGRVRG